MLGKSVCFVARFWIFFFYIYRPIYRHIGFFNHKIFVSVSALKILYRSGSNTHTYSIVCCTSWHFIIVLSIVYYLTLAIAVVYREWVNLVIVSAWHLVL